MKLNLQLVKQGNSLCVRIPKKVASSLKVSENDMVEIEIKKFERTPDKEYLENMLKVRKKFKELQKFSEEQIIVLATLQRIQTFEILENKKYDKEDLKKFDERIRKDFGKSMLNNYREFIDFFDKYPDKSE